MSVNNADKILFSFAYEEDIKKAFELLDKSIGLSNTMQTNASSTAESYKKAAYQFQIMKKHLSEPMGNLELKYVVDNFVKVIRYDGHIALLKSSLQLDEISYVFGQIIMKARASKAFYDAHYGTERPVPPKKKPVASRIADHNEKAKKELELFGKLDEQFQNYPFTKEQRDAFFKQRVAIAQVNDFKASAKSDAIPLFVESKKMETCSIETACTIGERKYMEDRFLSAVIPFKANGHEHTAEVCAVFDGHGGLKTVQFAVSELLSILKSKLNRFEKKELNEDDIFYALKEAIGHLHKAVIKNQFSDGTTLVLSFKVGDQLWVANVGDSSAFINRNGEVIPMSIAQKPALIKDSQGKAVYNEYAKQLMCNGVSRCLPKSKKNPEVDELSEKEADALQSGERMFMTISDGDDKRIHCMLGAMMEGGNITLDMARSIGDPFFAPWKKFTPEIFRQTIKPGDQLILHSDGVAVGMHAVAKTIEADKKDGISAWETVANIVQASVPEGDNITAMIVTFSKVTGDKTENIN